MACGLVACSMKKGKGCLGTYRRCNAMSDGSGGIARLRGVTVERFVKRRDPVAASIRLLVQERGAPA